ncbi:hypothetical protein KUCAC02_001194 [Chaenocephalus aceratus]|uniref:Uncharacterized protein n=1 Tax=Chaenocephalus aceratus TaxID=36190 RepID=A0ACB9XWJ4_CHAAC|nr:hypothetical protein KUCAC02_001194 [Chaenocephalus aceratus]
MEGTEIRNRTDPDQSMPGQDTRESSTQTDCRLQGHGPRLSKVNLFTLLSLWMELFPQEQPEEDEPSEIRRVGLVVVQDSKVVGLHCSGPELHAGQAAIIQHGASLADCHLYFSRRPCATCLKMIVNAGVSQISFWPGDPEVSMLRSSSANTSSPQNPPRSIPEEAALDAVAAEKLKSNTSAPGLAQFVYETSRDCDFMERMKDDDPGLNTEELFNRERTRHLKDFSSQLLVRTSLQHREILTHMGLEDFCVEPHFSNLRNNMTELVEVLAAVAAGLPQQHYGFYRLLAYRTEDPKVGVGAVIWAKGASAGSDGTGCLYLVGCGYNAYPAGSQYAEYPQMDNKQKDRQRRKYRYIVHAEQNALTFSSLKDTSKFIWQRSPSASSHHTNGFGAKHGRPEEQESHSNKKLCTHRSDMSPVS